MAWIGQVLKRIADAAESAGEKDKGIKNSDSFCFNESFSSPTRLVRIAMASLDDANSAKRVEEDRSVAIEAAIVRIMKVSCK